MNLEIINELLFDEELGKNRFLTYEEETEIFLFFKPRYDIKIYCKEEVQCKTKESSLNISYERPP